MNIPVTFDRLDHVAAEVLPGRTILFVVVTPMGGGGAIAGGGGDTAILSLCQTTTTYTEPGVAGAEPRLQCHAGEGPELRPGGNH
ncbi:MAG TPA: hypothetical protein VGR26_16765 [Acidimicrobiales bacterium]|nr:hypothetical protein [Acidimicrobiales bacterium]